MKKIDYAISGLIGFFAGIFAIPVFVNIGMRDPFILLATPWAVALASVLGALVVGGVLGRKSPFFVQFAKFAVVGASNTAIDFGILNLISMMTGVTGGLIIGGVNIPGVALALINAYFWNKYWVFNHRDNKGILHDLPTFLLVSGIGVVGNSSIVILATSYPIASINASTWLNLAKVMATVFSLVWNFLGYKFIVFRSSVPVSAETTPRNPIAPL